VTLQARISATSKDQYRAEVARLRAKVADLEREADWSIEHARRLRDTALDLRGQWYRLVDRWVVETTEA
jgi:hypothetical protein